MSDEWGDRMLDPAAAEANQAYGALTESLHIAGYTLERAFRSHLEPLIGGDAWRRCGPGFDDINVFMDSLRLDKFRLIADERRQIVARIKELQPNVTNRRIAKMLGVDHQTVNNDMAGEGSPPAPEKANKANGAKNVRGESSPPRLTGRQAAGVVDRCERASAQRARNAETGRAPAPLPEGKYETLVIDPPWPMEKSALAARPEKVPLLDYPTMSETELLAFGETVNRVAADDCHLFLWATQRFLPLAFRLIDEWGFQYGSFVMGWRKSHGMQPLGLPQFNLEHVVYARKGSPRFVDTKAFACCFDGARREHSRKPDAFYDLIRRVTGGSRIDVFSREPREGFDLWGDETAKFAEAGHG